MKCSCEAPESVRRGHTGHLSHPSRAGMVREAQDVQSTPGTTHIHIHRQISQPSNMAGSCQSAQQMAIPGISHAHSHGDFHSKSQQETRASNRLAHQHSMPAFMTSSGRRGSSHGPATQPVRQNPFVVADRATEESTHEPYTAQQSTRQRHQYSGSSQSHAHGSDKEASGSHSECSNPICRATHDGHYPYRHSIVCALHRSEASGPLSITRSPNSQSARDKSIGLEGTVRRHSPTRFHDHHHIVGHITGEISHETHEHYIGALEESVEEQLSPAPSSRPATRPGGQHHEHHIPSTPAQPLRRIDSLRDNRVLEPPSHSQHDRHHKPTMNAQHEAVRSPSTVNQSEKRISRIGQPQGIQSAKPTESSNTSYKRGEMEYDNHARQAHTVRGVPSQMREFDHNQPKHSGQKHQHNYVIDDDAVSGHETPKEQLHQRTTKEFVDDIAQNNSPIPRGRVFSPPPWLRAPSKEAGDARSRLRHVNTRIPRDPSHFRTTEKISKSPRGLPCRSIRESIEKLGLENNALPRISAPSPTTAWHVTQHQRPES